jgi:hypothetical protein
MNTNFSRNLSTLVLALSTLTAPSFALQAQAETMSPIKSCMKTMMYQSAVTAGGQLMHSGIGDMAAAIACQNANKSGFSADKVKSCMDDLMYNKPATTGGQILRSEISDVAAATACQNV